MDYINTMEVDNYEEVKFNNFIVENITNITPEDVDKNEFLLKMIDVDFSDQEQTEQFMILYNQGYYKKVIFNIDNKEYILYFSNFDSNPFGLIIINEYNYSIIENEWLNDIDNKEKQNSYEYNIKLIIKWLVDYTNIIIITNNTSMMEI
jgi:hypothetical protein